MQNNAYSQNNLPKFSEINLTDCINNLDQLIARHLAALDSLVKQPALDWDNFIYPIETMDDELDKFWSPISHLNAVKNSPQLREIYNQGIAKITEYATTVSHNSALYQAYNHMANSDYFASLSFAQQKVIHDALRDFKLSGVALPETDKQRFLFLQKRLSALTTQFADNVLDATNAWFLTITDEADLAGIPQHACQQAAHEAKKRNVAGWVFTLEFPAYYAVITYAKSSAVREKIYTAYVTRASDQGPHAGQWDNTAVMTEMLNIRYELSRLLGFNNYAEYSLATKMAKKPAEVLSFLQDLVQRARPAAQQEFLTLSQSAKEENAISSLQPWDVAFFSEKLRERTFSFSEEALRPYFPAPRVMHGLFTLIQTLYNVHFETVTDVDVWDSTVCVYAVYNQSQELLGYCYCDLYARANKQSGAWVDDYCSRRRLANGEIQLPVAYVTCNFTPAQGDQPALFTHDEVITLFHEFGHALHHLLTKMEYIAIAGTHGVAWDAVELPSQFMENWCWEPESLAMISGHYRTGEAIPQALYTQLIAAKNFQSAMSIVRQLTFALFDFRLHLEYNPQASDQIQQILQEVQQQVSVVPVAAFNRFQHSFSHIFAGGYAAGYYSYLWAEVLSSDAFAQFEETGLFNPATGASFLKNILEMGGSKEPMELFVAFRGREPQIDALLRHNGL